MTLFIRSHSEVLEVRNPLYLRGWGKGTIQPLMGGMQRGTCPLASQDDPIENVAAQAEQATLRGGPWMSGTLCRLLILLQLGREIK